MNIVFDSPKKNIVGCDPGPERCAFASLRVKDDGELEVTGLAYPSNREIHRAHTWNEFVDGVLSDGCWGRFPRLPDDPCLVFEKCGTQGVAPGQLTFETCMMAGEVRHIAHPEIPVYAFTPGDWRYVATGKAGANDSIIRGVLLDIIPEHDILVRKFSKEARSMYGLDKSITSHLRDALGTALSVGMLSYRRGLSIDLFKGVPDVR